MGWVHVATRSTRSLDDLVTATGTADSPLVVVVVVVGLLELLAVVPPLLGSLVVLLREALSAAFLSLRRRDCSWRPRMSSQRSGDQPRQMSQVFDCVQVRQVGHSSCSSSGLRKWPRESRLTGGEELVLETETRKHAETFSKEHCLHCPLSCYNDRFGYYVSCDNPPTLMISNILAWLRVG